MSDKRLVPEFGDTFWASRISRQQWDFCKYCVRDTPQFEFAEGRMGSREPTAVLRCCWECGAGLERIPVEDSLLLLEYALSDLEDEANGAL